MARPAVADVRARDAKSHARYTAIGDAVAEAHVDQDLARLATGIDSELGDALITLVLCGPFARGEGRVQLRDGEPQADLPGYQLIAVLKRRPERYQRALDTISATWTRLLRTRVALCGAAPEQLAAPPATRTWFHAGWGQALSLTGNPLVVSRIPQLDPTRFAPDEFAYALCEGFTALALAELEAHGEIDPLARALRWAVLGCGDALLLRRGLYAPTLPARAAALRSAQAPAALRALYASASDPSPAKNVPREIVEAGRRALCQVFLDLEAERAGTRRDVLGYVGAAEALLAPPVRSHGATAGALAFGRRLLGAEPVRHPLEAMLRATVAIALGPQVAACRVHAARWLADGAQPAASSRGAAPALRGGASLDGHALAERLRALAANTLVDRLAHPFGGWMLEHTAL